MKAHEYKSLDREKQEIRLLHLIEIIPSVERGSDNDCISGRLSYKYLGHDEESADIEHNDRDYMALSYVWGEPDYNSSVMLDDGTQIPITGNLLIALRHVFETGFAPVSTNLLI